MGAGQSREAVDDDTFISGVRVSTQQAHPSPPSALQPCSIASTLPLMPAGHTRLVGAVGRQAAASESAARAGGSQRWRQHRRTASPEVRTLPFMQLCWAVCNLVCTCMNHRPTRKALRKTVRIVMAPDRLPAHMQQATRTPFAGRRQRSLRLRRRGQTAPWPVRWSAPAWLAASC